MMQITELEVWKAAIDLAKHCYNLSLKFPEKEILGIGYMLRRTAASLPANVAAAASRKHGKESLRHLFRARDMIYEVESHLHLALSLEFISEDELNESLELLNTSKRLLFGFIKYYKRAGSGNRKRRNNRKRTEETYSEEDYGNSDLDSEDFEDIDLDEIGTEEEEEEKEV